MSFRLMCSTLRSDVVGESYERTCNVRMSSGGNDGREKARVTTDLLSCHPVALSFCSCT